MRRQDRYILNGVICGAGITSIIDIFIQWKEHAERGELFTWDSYDGCRTIRWAAIGGTAGGGLGYAYYCSKISDEAKKPFNSDEYVKKVLTKEHLKSNLSAVNKAICISRKT
jgi:hypothetical protein